MSVKLLAALNKAVSQVYQDDTLTAGVVTAWIPESKVIPRAGEPIPTRSTYYASICRYNRDIDGLRKIVVCSAFESTMTGAIRALAKKWRDLHLEQWRAFYREQFGR